MCLHIICSLSGPNNNSGSMDEKVCQDSVLVHVPMAMPQPELIESNANGEFGLCKRTKQVHLLSLQKFRLYNFITGHLRIMAFARSLVSLL